MATEDNEVIVTFRPAVSFVMHGDGTLSHVTLEWDQSYSHVAPRSANVYQGDVIARACELLDDMTSDGTLPDSGVWILAPEFEAANDEPRITIIEGQ